MSETDAATSPDDLEVTTAAGKVPWHTTPKGKRAMLAVGAAVPVTLVNAVAVMAQLGYLNANLKWAEPGRVMVAAALESVAIYLQAHAHLAQLANDSAFRLRIASYGMALGVGALNYSHYCGPHWRPTPSGLIFGSMSAISPWLWGVHSRRASRDELMRKGLVEAHALRLGATRWTWHALRAIRTMYRNTWHWEADPARAITNMEDRYPCRSGAPAGGTGHDDVPPAQPVPPVPPARPVPVLPPVPPVPPQSLPPVPPRPVPLLPVPPQTANGHEPAVHRAGAAFAADPRLPKGKPPEEVIKEAELTLAGTAVDQLPSIREVARNLLHDPNQRRLAEKLLSARRAAEQEKAGAPPQEMNHRQPNPNTAQQMRVPPAWQAGGVNG